MSRHTPTGLNWEEAMEPLAARRRALAEYLAKDIHGRAQAIASLVRRRPAAVDASVLRRAAQSAGRRR
jgi:hypothetical protein